ncbi:hypothetical protein HF078_16370 [Bacillus sp. RO2]|uniref:hypothetical protein n=1 Tax=Bacillus sp. RO2 TaxID=2723913 RepID=UPI00145CA3D3|nr:hypothetical protein [Bacillus sp. RO2]NMH74658.1 hypothetical protein [Bacillus sp. RO2]
MAFGINRGELQEWKEKVKSGEIAFLTHYWIHPRYDGITTVTKAGCSDVNKLIKWGHQYGLKEEWIHKRNEYPHFDLIGDTQLEILKKEGQWNQINRFFDDK